MKYITRIAPSPTGDMHLGTLRTAYFNYLAAKASGGTFILRIDDTDKNRNDLQSLNDIYDIFGWLNLVPDELIKQSDNTKSYKTLAAALYLDGHAVELDNGAIALKYPEGMPDTWEDEIAGTITISDTNKEQIHKRLILLKGDGSPTYQLASTVDDWQNNINYIIRGVDHISNTPKQLAIWHCLDILAQKENITNSFPKFAHVGLLFQNKKKMSKRDGASSVLQYKKLGYSPEAILNFVLKMGWSEKGGKTINIIPKEMAEEIFLTQGQMRNQNCNLDVDKLEFYQRKYK